jgi:hypothetical protein
MIDGFKFQITTEELATHLMTKREEHIKMAGQCEERGRLLASVNGSEDGFGVRGFAEDEPFDASKISSSHQATCLAGCHRRRADFLRQMASHLPKNETFLLGHDELIALEFAGTFATSTYERVRGF